MSEISDAVQIIRVGYDTIEIAMKVGSGSIEMMQKVVNLLIGLLEHEKTMGKTNLKGLLEKGGDIQILTFADEDLKSFRSWQKIRDFIFCDAGCRSKGWDHRGAFSQ